MCAAYSDTSSDEETQDGGEMPGGDSVEKTEGEQTVQLSTGGELFYYEKARAEQGVSVIVSFGTAYGFQENIALKDDVRAAVNAEAQELTATPEQMFFFPVVDGSCDILRYTSGSYRLDFFFRDDFLVATTLTDTENWTD